MKKSGSVYYFYSPQQPASTAAYAGRLYRIYGRNWNNYIEFDYSWSGGATAASNLTQIAVNHSDGQSLTLQFGTSGSCTQDLLLHVIRPDGLSIDYSYDANCNLNSVTKPGNNAGSITHTYGWNAGHQLNWVSSPRWYANNPNEGAYVNFNYFGASSAGVSSVQYGGVVNFTPPDNSDGSLLQPTMPSGNQQFAVESFTGYGSGTTSVSDKDGHGTTWSYDNVGRVTHTNEVTGDASGPASLDTYASWDPSNNLISTTDARGNETDYAYDNNGNAIAVALPQVSTSQGTLRPTSLYSYDNFNNVTAYCDAAYTARNSLSWTSRPNASDTLCPTSGSARFVYNYSDTTVEPYGTLTDTYTPLGYHRQISYNTSIQGGDFGLPTSVMGDPITGQADGTSRQPQQYFWYDGNGNLLYYNKLSNSQTANGAWSLHYDALNNRLTSITDPDNVTSYTCYYPNGQTKATSTAAQYALDNVACGTHAVSYTYDPDDNLIGETHHFGNVPGTTRKWYDGADRLVEVMEPQGGFQDNWGNTQSYDVWPWITRYDYDLSEGSSVSIEAGTAFYAHGNLYKTQRWLPGNRVVVVPGASSITTASAIRRNASARAKSNLAHRIKELLRPGTVQFSGDVLVLRAPRAGFEANRDRSVMSISAPPGRWLDIKGAAFDGLDRKVAEYTYVPGCNPLQVVARQYSYDSNGAGLLASVKFPVGDTVNYSYDALAQPTAISFSLGPTSTFTANRSYSYDADGRVTTVGSVAFGNWTYAFDADDRLVSALEPVGGGSGVPGASYPDSGVLTSAANFQYSYYPDGVLKSVAGPSSSSSASYRNDGLPSSNSYSVLNGAITRQYTAAGRLLSKSDPGRQ